MEITLKISFWEAQNAKFEKTTMPVNVRLNRAGLFSVILFPVINIAGYLITGYLPVKLTVVNRIRLTVRLN